MKDKGFKMGILVAVIAMVVVVGIGYAAFTATLNINGTAKVEASSCNVHFAMCSEGMPAAFCSRSGNLQAFTPTVTVTTQPTLTDTTISDWDISFKTPGDTYSYNFKVVNDGSFDAKISTFALPTPTCTGTGENAETDAANVCKHLVYTLSYAELLPTDQLIVKVGGTLNKASSRTMVLRLQYKDDVTAEELPKGDVTISNLGFSIVYAQA